MLTRCQLAATPLNSSHDEVDDDRVTFIAEGNVMDINPYFLSVSHASHIF